MPKERKVFISYARVNRAAVEELVEHLEMLGCETWVDSSLHGGQDWWDVVLQQIADCDVFLAILSRAALDSLACRSEFDWAEALGKPVVPVAVEPQPKALPRRFSMLQIVDYSDPKKRDRAAVLLAGALAMLPPAPPLPQPLPQSPAAPLSYLTDLVDVVSQVGPLDHEQQFQILLRLKPAIRSVDPEERQGARDILELFDRRDDIFADAARMSTWLKQSIVSEDGAPLSKTDLPTQPDLRVHLGDEHVGDVGDVVHTVVDVPEKKRHPGGRTAVSGDDAVRGRAAGDDDSAPPRPIAADISPTGQQITIGSRRLSRRTVSIGLGGIMALVAGGAVIQLVASGSRTESSSAPTLSGKPGAVLWMAPAGNTMIFSSPTLGDGSVFVAGYDRNVYALQQASGAERWTATTDDRVLPSPAFADGRVYVASWDGNVYALDADSGDEQWKVPVGEDSFPASPVVADDTVYFGGTDWYVNALDAATGDVRWKRQTNRAATAAPAVADGVLYIGTEGYVVALDAQSGTERWSKAIGGQTWSRPAVADGRVFLGNDDHSVYALDAGTGEVSWTRPTDGPVYSSPAAVGGLIYVGSNDTNVYALDADSGEVQWKAHTDGQVYSSPAVADGTVYIGSFDGFLYALAATDGAVRWKTATGGQVWSSPTVAENTVYIGSHDGKIYAVER